MKRGILAGKQYVADAYVRIFHLCDRCLSCMIAEYSGVYYLDYKYVTARKAGSYLLARTGTGRGWDNW